MQIYMQPLFSINAVKYKIVQVTLKTIPRFVEEQPSPLILFLLKCLFKSLDTLRTLKVTVLFLGEF